MILFKVAPVTFAAIRDQRVILLIKEQFMYVGDLRVCFMVCFVLECIQGDFNVLFRSQYTEDKHTIPLV